jgi:hypothetical protein
MPAPCLTPLPCSPTVALRTVRAGFPARLWTGARSWAFAHPSGVYLTCRNEDVANPDNYALACMPLMVASIIVSALSSERAAPRRFGTIANCGSHRDRCAVRLVLNALHVCNSSYSALVTGLRLRS